MHRPVYVAHRSFIEGSHKTKNCVTEEQIFDACHTSATRISAPKRLAVVVNKKKISILIETSFWS
jgi:hypothetical protein